MYVADARSIADDFIIWLFVFGGLDGRHVVQRVVTVKFFMMELISPVSYGV